MHGGDWVAEVFRAQGVQFVFTLTGGHIAPILVGCKQRGIRVVDVRHEVNAVFAADAVARLSGVPGVAVVTAGPGVTNTLTAVKNAQMAQSPVVLIGGAAATALKGRGALQDIDQLALFDSVVKWSRSVRHIRDLVPTLERAFAEAQRGVPGPVFVEIPIDLLYDEQTVRALYNVEAPTRSLGGWFTRQYLRWHVGRLFAGKEHIQTSPLQLTGVPIPSPAYALNVAERLQQAKRPLMLIGSQAMLSVPAVTDLAAAVEHIGVPVYLSGMARGLLGRDHPLHMRHARRQALKDADLVILAGVPCDFRLDYGRSIPRTTFLVSANRSRRDLKMNRRPNVRVLGDPSWFLRQLAAYLPSDERWGDWLQELRQRDTARNAEIAEQALVPTDRVNPLHLCREIAAAAPDNAIFVADGGDFVATASYIVQPPGPLSWLDPGPFGTLGVGAGFALGAKLCRPESEVWLLYGDGAAGYSLAEFDTFVRHHVPVIAVVGNDAGWTQIAREQIDILQDDVATTLAYTDYDCVVYGFGGMGFKLDDPELAADVLAQARHAADGRPVLVNTLLGKTDFRKGSISM
ncbi:MAG TPA: thiamine pyrophosphate-binding protein [Roseiflexaceae bacterium]|nr:thiamine pyrophosphate-binding protein [Roseiflexaceae bacterium]